MTAQLRTNTDLHALAQVLAWFDQFNQPKIPHLVWLQCQLALAEGFTNAVRHAHQGKPSSTAIDIEVTVSEDYLEIQIWDFGAGFNLEETLTRSSEKVNSEAEGGRGLKLIQQVADVFSYTRINDQQNCLLIIKKYETNC